MGRTVRAPAPKSRRILLDGRPAPALWVRFQCPACHVSETADAYRGVALHPCTNPPTVMCPERIMDALDVVSE